MYEVLTNSSVLYRPPPVLVDSTNPHGVHGLVEFNTKEKLVKKIRQSPCRLCTDLLKFERKIYILII
jgi:hypothetical protein